MTTPASLTYDDVVTPEAVWSAYARAVRGKGRRCDIQRFALSAGPELDDLYHELHARTYRPRPCRTFWRYCPCGQKMRLIAAPALRDTVVHRLIYDALYPILDPHFIYDSYGCRIGKGPRRCADRLHAFMRQAQPGETHYLQLDISKYYYSIDHTILRSALSRHLADPELLDLCMTPCGAGGMGVQTGTLTAQLYGLLYLDRFDHFCKRVLKCRRYLRYVDDIVIPCIQPERGRELLDIIRPWLRDTLHLSLSRFTLLPMGRGINFVGYRTWPTHRLVRKKHIRHLRRAVRQGRQETITALLAHAAGTASHQHMAALAGRLP